MPYDTQYHLFDRWTNEHWGPCSGSVEMPETPPHGVRLLSVHLHRGHSQVIGSTMHLLSGAVELVDHLWSDDRLRCPGEHSGDLVIYVPPGYNYQGGAPEPLAQRGDLLVIDLRLIDHMTLTLHFQGR